MATVKDAVCGMEIDPKDAAAISDYEGTTYYFCAIACKERFDAEPAKFLGTAEVPARPSLAQEPSRKEPAAPVSEPRKWWQIWRR
jgi:Cu+-exporting ATPase